MFALSALEQLPLQVSLKCEPELARELRLAHEAINPGYHLNKRHWNTVTLDGSLPRSHGARTGGGLYDAIVAALPQATRTILR